MTVAALGFRECPFMMPGLLTSGKDQAGFVCMVPSYFKRAADHGAKRNGNVMTCLAVADGQGPRASIEIGPRRAGQLARPCTRQEIAQMIGAPDWR